MKGAFESAVMFTKILFPGSLPTEVNSADIAGIGQRDKPNSFINLPGAAKLPFRGKSFLYSQESCSPLSPHSQGCIV